MRPIDDEDLRPFWVPPKITGLGEDWSASSSRQGRAVVALVVLAVVLVVLLVAAVANTAAAGRAEDDRSDGTGTAPASVERLRTPAAVDRAADIERGGP